jgi:hypothetical protein
LAKKYGVQAAAELAEFENANIRAVTEYVTKEKVDCDFVLTRAIDVQLTEDSHRSVEQAHKLACSAGVKSTKETFVVPEQHAEKVCAVFWAACKYTAFLVSSQISPSPDALKLYRLIHFAGFWRERC